MITFEHEGATITLEFTHGTTVVRPWPKRPGVGVERENCTAKLTHNGEQAAVATVVRSNTDKHSLGKARKYALAKALNEGWLRYVGNFQALKKAVWAAYLNPWDTQEAKKLPAEAKLTAVDLAKDVLRLLDAKSIKAQSGYYCTLPDSWTYKSGTSVQEHLRSNPKDPCGVCALGSLFMSFVDRHNQVSMPDNWVGLNYDATMIEKLSPYFSMKQLVMIETAFEGTLISARGVAVEGDWIYQCKKFLDAYYDKDRRLRAIMQNIIDNGGEFKP